MPKRVVAIVALLATLALLTSRPTFAAAGKDGLASAKVLFRVFAPGS
ncbi:MAG: hypothetical protein ACYSX0_17765 [Planctomycetota bacterium]|jgi:hypothetical protein